MILKLKYDMGWSFIPIPSLVQIEKTVLPGDKNKDIPEKGECKIKIYAVEDWNMHGDKEPLKIIITYDEAYLISGEGKTIERIN